VINRITYIGLFLLLPFFAHTQKGMYTFGIQYKPLIPFRYFTPSTNQIVDNYQTTVSPRLGYSYGMVVRRGITNTIAIEFGVNYIKRNYGITLDSVPQQLNVIDKTNFGLVSYELPIQGLFYVRLFEDIYMNGASGLSVNFFASNVESNGDFMRHASYKYRWVDMALLSNLGFEYRTKNNGFFYLGASFHLPFHSIMQTRVRYDDGVSNTNFVHDLGGRYFTIDLRYFFKDQSKPMPKAKKKKKNKG
jgi:hypothetical protein